MHYFARDCVPPGFEEFGGRGYWIHRPLELAVVVAASWDGAVSFAGVFGEELAFGFVPRVGFGWDTILHHSLWFIVVNSPWLIFQHTLEYVLDINGLLRRPFLNHSGMRDRVQRSCLLIIDHKCTDGTVSESVRLRHFLKQVGAPPSYRKSHLAFTAICKRCCRRRNMRLCRSDTRRALLLIEEATERVVHLTFASLQLE